MTSNTFQLYPAAEDGVTRLHLEGQIDEQADLSAMTQDLGDELHLDLSKVRRINSFGVRMWLSVMRSIPETTAIYLHQCSPPIVDQCNMVLGFLGRAQIVSFQVPLICEDCNRQQAASFDTEACLALNGRLPETPCPECGQPMQVDDLEDHYLHFLHM